MMINKAIALLILLSLTVCSLSACTSSEAPAESIEKTTKLTDSDTSFIHVESDSIRHEEDFTGKVTETEPIPDTLDTDHSVQDTDDTSNEIVTTEKEDEPMQVGGQPEEVEPTYIDGILIVNKSYALPSTYNPGVSYEAKSAFDTMAAAAYSDGISLYIISDFRTYDYQAGLYQRYVNRSGRAEADRYSARAGHSEHQTGLAFDLNSLEQSFGQTAAGIWLAEHCHEYGFIIRYPEDKEHITGYMYEPWHIRYLGTETAANIYESGLCLEEYLGITSEYAD